LALMAAALVALVVTGCSDSEDGGGTYTVNVDGKTDAFNGGFIAYFPNALTVHQGDTVDFKSIWSGEPHTVTMGTLVDRGLEQADASPEAEEEPADLAKIPELITEPPQVAVNQSAGQPCFLVSGDPPPDAACTEAQQEQPDFDGTQTYYNSGWLEANEVFKVKLADDIEPGTYRFFCNLHRAGQQGRITVVASEAEAQTPSEVTEAGEDQLNEMVTKLTPAAEALKTGTLPPVIPAPVPGQVLSGSGSEEVQEGLIDEFGPKDFRVGVGGAVTWVVVGPHTISFNSPIGPGDYIKKESNGTVTLDEAAFNPAGGPPVIPPEGPPPAAPGPPIVTDGGAWDGTGFRSSGFVASFPPSLLAYKLTFTKAGTYNYVCIIHPAMVGTITVA
jgi:plastocyanin